MPTGSKVKDAMVLRAITGAPDQTILEASKVMKDQDIGSLIITDGNSPIGIITREDIVGKVVAANLQPSSVLVKDVMSKNLVTVGQEEDISEAARLMSKNMYERIPVVSDGMLIGIISTREIARVAPAALEVMTEHLRIQEPGSFDDGVQSGDCEKCGNYSDNLKNVNDSWLCDSCGEEV